MPTSPEFLTLCRTQLALLTQMLEASLSVVYLTRELVEDGSATGLIPVVVYPEASAAWVRPPFPVLPEEDLPQLVARPGLPLALPAADLQEPLDWETRALVSPHRLMLPLIHEGIMLGLLVTEREDQPWTGWEQVHVERIAGSLVLACVLDQRYQWLRQEQQQQRLLQAQQQDLLDNLLHQFRNPLTALRTFGKLLLKRLKPEDANREVAISIVRESDRLQELLQQFDQAIDLSAWPISLEPDTWAADMKTPAPEASARTSLPPAGGLLPGAVPLRACEVDQVLQPLLSSVRAIAQERGLTLLSQPVAGLPPVMANPEALREVLSNLLDNALKYTPEGGCIYVQTGLLHLHQAEVWQGVSISDTGPGIPATDLDHVFERHYRGIQAKTDIPGSGLGLAIVRHLVQQMQGEIQVFSPARLQDQWGPTATAAGTTFIVWLPQVG